MAIIDNLIFFYEMEEATPTVRHDAHGSNHLSEGVNPVGTGTGIIGNGVDFESSGSPMGLSCADNTDIAVTNASFAFVIWINMESKSGSFSESIFNKHNGASAEYFIDRYLTNDRFRFQMCQSSGFGSIVGVEATSFGAPTTGVFYMLYIEFDAAADTIGISVNAGTLDTTGGATAGPFATNGPLRVGNDTFGNLFDGIMDNFAFWKGRKLSGAEVTWLYNGGASRSYFDVTVGMGGGAKPWIYRPHTRTLGAGFTRGTL